MSPPEDSPNLPAGDPPDETRPSAQLQRVEQQKAVAPTKDDSDNVFPLDPMATKFLSLSDLFRQTGFSFHPHRLLRVGVLLVPLTLVVSMLLYAGSSVFHTMMGGILYLFAFTLGTLGISLICTLTAFRTRRGIEGEETTFGEEMEYAVSRLRDILLLPWIAVVPMMLLFLVMALMGLLRDQSPEMATAFRAGYFLFIILALLILGGGVLLHMMLAYIPAILAVDTHDVFRGVRDLWGYARRQPMRLTAHTIFLCTGMFLVFGVFIFLTIVTFEMPEKIFGFPEDEEVLQSWRQMNWLMTVYFGILLGTALTFPVSLFGTAGTLSYLVLQQEDDVLLESLPGDTGSGERSPAETREP